MASGSSARTIDISDLVRLRRHFYWSSQAMLLLGLGCVGTFGAEEARDVGYFAADAALAFVTSFVLYKGVVAAVPPLSIALVAFNGFLFYRFLARVLPIDANEEEVQLLIGVTAVAATLYVLGIWLTPFFRRARRSRYLPLMFATNSRLGADYAGAALTWKGRLRQLRPWAVVVAVLTFVVSLIAMLLASKGTGRRNPALEKQIRNAVFAAGGALFVWTKRKHALRGTAVREIDQRPPVLLLRSFDDDMMVVLKGARYSSATDLRRKGMTFERVVEDYLSPFGPFIAIGRPEEPLSPLGAARDYVPDAVWQEEVQARIRDAAVVVLIIGTSQGLAWELWRLRDLGQLHKLILLFPPSDDVVHRWQTLRERDRATDAPILPDEVRPERTLALIYADDLTPIIVEGKSNEWSYQTALRLGGMLAITTGVEPALPAQV